MNPVHPIASLEDLALAVIFEQSQQQLLSSDHRYDDWIERISKCSRCNKYRPRSNYYKIHVECGINFPRYCRCYYCEWIFDIELVISQTNAPLDRVKTVLIKHKGDLVEAIFDIVYG